ncbi:MAG: class I SAM-dependent methyltransferase [Planctomycetota bacterium]|jgi:cyclopropane fatty-acyl-phospholipid synthase-like methyltransferase
MQKAQTKKWYEDESFWETFAPAMFNQQRLDIAAEEIDRLIKLLDLEKGARILDLCCGIGRHSLELARRGYDVIGVDLNEKYLAKAHKQAESEKLSIEFVRDDMRRFCLLDGFDVVINMFTAFGYFESHAENKRVLTNIYCSLRQGGKLIMDMIGKEVLARIYRERDWHEEDGRIFLQECKIQQNWSWADNRWIVLQGSKQKEFRFGHRIYSAVEITSLLKDCGFTSVNIYGDLTGTDYDHNAKRLIAVAQK